MHGTTMATLRVAGEPDIPPRGLPIANVNRTEDDASDHAGGSDPFHWQDPTPPLRKCFNSGSKSMLTLAQSGNMRSLCLEGRSLS